MQTKSDRKLLWDDENDPHFYGGPQHWKSQLKRQLNVGFKRGP